MKLRAYRWLHRRLIESAVLQGPLRATREERQKPLPQLLPSLRRRIWFHAASAGELESLWSVIEQSSRRGDDTVVTIFSPSASSGLKSLVGSLPRAPEYSGYSPWEGRWGEALDAIKPTQFVTAKYEAWPELWVALSDRKIPLMIVGAKSRRSLQFAARACRFLGRSLPVLSFALADEDDRAELVQDFPKARFETTGDPRWDRVFARVEAGNPRARQLLTSHAASPRPWGILAQIWPKDIQVWGTAIRGAAETLWIVPHQIDSNSLAAIEIELQRLRITYRRTSIRDTSTARVILVDEMGFLTELYGGVDWAFVGGGFGKSMHSTIEPAVRGIPIACGPNGQRKFSEVALLSRTGQLTVVENQKQIENWLKSFPTPASTGWLQHARSQKGAADRVLEFLDRIYS